MKKQISNKGTLLKQTKKTMKCFNEMFQNNDILLFLSRLVFQVKKLQPT